MVVAVVRIPNLTVFYHISGYYRGCHTDVIVNETVEFSLDPALSVENSSHRTFECRQIPQVCLLASHLMSCYAVMLKKRPVHPWWRFCHCI